MIRQMMLCALAAGLAASPAHSQDESDMSERLLACRDIASEGPRLACFDQLVIDRFGKNAEVEQQREANFGLPESTSDVGDDELSATITEVQIDNRYGTVVIALDNGQVWQATSTGTIRRGFKAGRKVTIRSGSFGAFRLYMEGSKGFRGVKRLR